MHEQRSVEVDADEMWKRIGYFHGIADWHSAIEAQTSEGGDDVRELRLGGGGIVVETLLELGPRFYTYRIVESPLPVHSYTATVAVSDGEHGGTTIAWTADFEPEGASEDEAKEVIADTLTSGLGAL